jgi:hypothetical protein
MKIPTTRCYNKAYKNRDDVIQLDTFPIQGSETVKLTFESMNSPSRQGVWVGCNDRLEINGIVSKSFNLWYDTAPREVMIKTFSKEGLITVYNLFEAINHTHRFTFSLSYHSGMLIEELPNGRRYSCNDVGFDSPFNKLIFRIEYISD